MRFVIGADVANSRATGMGRQMYGLGEALCRRGHDVEYLFRESLRRSLSQRWSRLEFPLRVAHYLRNSSHCAGAFAILHEPIGWPTAAFARGRGVRLLSMVHACELKGWKTTLSARAAMGANIRWSSRVAWPATELWQCWLSVRWADAVICLSSEDRNYLRDTLGVSASRLFRLDNGLEREFLGLPPLEETDRDVLWVASWLPRKGTKTFVKALELLAGKGLAPSITLAGIGVSEEEVRATLPASVRRSAVIMPRVDPRELVGLYRKHKVFVLPSVLEGIPLSLLEAMACGLCPIATAVGGVPDVLEDAREGILVPPLDEAGLATALERALRDPRMAKDLGSQAQARMQRYSWDRVAVDLEDALKTANLVTTLPG